MKETDLEDFTVVCLQFISKWQITKAQETNQNLPKYQPKLRQISSLIFQTACTRDESDFSPAAEGAVLASGERLVTC